jgi:hypothetical protein
VTESQFEREALRWLTEVVIAGLAFVKPGIRLN